MNSQKPVVIIGGGIAGATLGCYLALHGIAVRILESSEQPVKMSRFKELQPQTLEVFRMLGIINSVLTESYAYPMELSPAPSIIRNLPSVQEAPARLAVTRQILHNILLGRLKDLGVRVDLGVDFEDIEVQGQDITLSYYKNQDSEAVQCSYLVGADKGKSLLSDLWGKALPMGRLSEQQYFMACFKLNDERLPQQAHNSNHCLLVPERPHVYQYVAPMLLSGAVGHQWLSQSLSMFLGCDIQVPQEAIRWTSLYNPTIGSLQHSSGYNVALIGKTVRHQSFILSNDLNASIQDAFNLGWHLVRALVTHKPLHLEPIKQSPLQRKAKHLMLARPERSTRFEDPDDNLTDNIKA